jgi:hypothetical protein
MRPKHNYIRRKKCLKESICQVKATLNLINCLRPDKVDPTGIDLLARRRASEIEAACWNSHTENMTDELYQTLLRHNTKQLCLALLAPHLPQENLPQVAAVLGALNLLPVPASPIRGAPAPRAFAPLPVPIIRESKPQALDARDVDFDIDPSGFPPPDPFLDFGGSRRDDPDIFLDGYDY